MANDTVRDFTAAEMTIANTALGAAETDLTDAVKKAGDAATEVEKAARNMTGEASTGAAIRLKLASATSAAEVAALSDELMQHEIRLHGLEAKASTAQNLAGAAKARVTRASAAVARAKQATADAQRASDDAVAQDSAWQKVTAAVALMKTAGQADAFKAAVTAVKTSPDYVAAQQRVERDVPQPPRNDARGRAATLSGAVGTTTALEAPAETAAANAYVAHQGKSGAVVGARLDCRQKRERLRAIADASRQLDDIVAALKAIADAPVLSSAASNRVSSAKQSVASAQTALDQAEQDIVDQNVKITAKQAQIDGAANAAAAQPFVDEMTILVRDLGTLTATRDQLKADRDAVSNVYEDSIPEESWRRLSAFDDTTRRLDALKLFTDAAITTAVTDSTNAEKALATALKAEADGRREIAAAEAASAGAHDAGTAERERGQTQLLAYLRGDV